MKQRICVLVVVMVVAFVSSSTAANRIQVESVTAAPGEQDILVRVLIDHDDGLWALSFAARFPAELTYEGMTLDGTELGPLPAGVEAEYFQPIQRDDYFGAAILIDLDAEYDWRTLPAGDAQYVLGVQFSVASELICGDELAIDLRNDLGPPDGPVIEAVFTVPTGDPPERNARSVLPALEDGAVTIQLEPGINGVTPNVGSTAGGTPVTITGTNLDANTIVTFGAAPLENVVVVSSTEITGETPANPEGPVDVTVSNSCGEAVLGTAFGYIVVFDQPLLHAVAPKWIRTGGGTPITLTGENFTDDLAVLVGGELLENPELIDATTFRGTAPAHAAGSVSVEVSNDGGSAGLDDAITYVDSPTISAITPASGAGDVTVTITGTGFTDNADTGVLFGFVEVTDLDVVSPTELICRFPGCGDTTGWVEVTVTTSGGFTQVTEGYRCGGETTFRRGDANCDSSLDVADAISILAYLFSGGQVNCVDSCDVNDDGGVNIADAIFLLAYTFSGGQTPPAPFPDLGVDPTPDEVPCEMQCGA